MSLPTYPQENPPSAETVLRAATEVTVQQVDKSSVSLQLVTLGRQAQKQQRLLLLLLASPLIYLILCMFIVSLWGPAGHSGEANSPLIQVIEGVPPLAAFLAFLFLHRRFKSTTLRTLAQAEDVRAIGPLIELQINLGDQITDKLPKQALIRLLPRLKANEAALLSNYQYGCLCQMLIRYGDTEFRMAILHALEQIGDGQAIPAVKHILRDGLAPSNVREEARRTLPILQERRKQGNASTTLLRASEADSKGLLHTVEQTPGVGMEQLLRATVPEEEQEG